MPFLSILFVDKMHIAPSFVFITFVVLRSGSSQELQQEYEFEKFPCWECLYEARHGQNYKKSSNPDTFGHESCLYNPSELQKTVSCKSPPRKDDQAFCVTQERISSTTDYFASRECQYLSKEELDQIGNLGESTPTRFEVYDSNDEIKLKKIYCKPKEGYPCNGDFLKDSVSEKGLDLQYLMDSASQIVSARPFTCKNCDLRCYECSFNSWENPTDCGDDLYRHYYDEKFLTSDTFTSSPGFENCDQSFGRRGYHSQFAGETVSYMCGLRGWELGETKVLRRRCIAYLSDPPEVGCTYLNMTFGGYIVTEFNCDTDGCNKSIDGSRRTNDCRWFEKISSPLEHSPTQPEEVPFV